jgi:hypothetical protein
MRVDLVKPKSELENIIQKIPKEKNEHTGVGQQSNFVMKVSRALHLPWDRSPPPNHIQEGRNL